MGGIADNSSPVGRKGQEEGMAATAPIRFAAFRRPSSDPPRRVGALPASLAAIPGELGTSCGKSVRFLRADVRRGAAAPDRPSRDQASSRPAASGPVVLQQEAWPARPRRDPGQRLGRRVRPGLRCRGSGVGPCPPGRSAGGPAAWQTGGHQPRCSRDSARWASSERGKLRQK
jgi:hypothetical protein